MNHSRNTRHTQIQHAANTAVFWTSITAMSLLVGLALITVMITTMNLWQTLLPAPTLTRVLLQVTATLGGLGVWIFTGVRVCQLADASPTLTALLRQKRAEVLSLIIIFAAAAAVSVGCGAGAVETTSQLFQLS